MTSLRVRKSGQGGDLEPKLCLPFCGYDFADDPLGVWTESTAAFSPQTQEDILFA